MTDLDPMAARLVEHWRDWRDRARAHGQPMPHAQGQAYMAAVHAGSIEALVESGAADDVLADPDTNHVATFHAVGFTIRHPLHERLAGGLESCALYEYCAAMTNPPPPGRYRVDRDPVEGGWSFTLVEAPA
jgi:hypothetical protein